MASADERRILKSPNRDAQEAVKIVRGLTQFLIKIIQQSLEAMKVDYKRFGSQSIYVNTLVDKLRESKVTKGVAW